jgi:hypothetical protein
MRSPFADWVSEWWAWVLWTVAVVGFVSFLAYAVVKSDEEERRNCERLGGKVHREYSTVTMYGGKGGVSFGTAETTKCIRDGHEVFE